MTITVDDFEMPDLPITGRHFQDLAMLTEPDLVMRSHLMMEQLLDYFINKVIGHDQMFNDLRLSFAQKITVARNLGLRQELVSFIRRLNRLRNRFAHNIDYLVTPEDISELKSLVNSCFLSQLTNVQDNSRLELVVDIQIAGERITRQVSTLHQDASNQQKLLHIIMVFLGQKFITYLRLVAEDCAVLDQRSTDRINDFIMNEPRYRVSNT